TGFGYIRMGAAIGGQEERPHPILPPQAGEGDQVRPAAAASIPLKTAAREIAAFVEKPDRERAQQYGASGEYAWDSGMFCFRADALLDAAERHCPDVFAAAQACHASASGSGSPVEYERERFLAMPDISIDYAVMERAERRAVVPATFDWSDIGSWKAVSELD